jgi:hypothetical protein
MRHRFAAIAAVIVAGLTLAGSSLAFDCIRVSSSLHGLQESTKSGNWLLFDLSSRKGVTNTLASVVGVDVTAEQADCFVSEYGKSGQPLYFALGIGVAGGKKASAPTHGARAAAGAFGVIAWNNNNERVLRDGNGIDHFEDTAILPALLAAAGSCGIELPAEE